jgi:DNA-binding NarL/FixJ family response regulator
VLHLNASARGLLVDNRFMRVEKLTLRFIQPKLHASFEAALRRATQEAPCSSLLPIVSRGEVVYEVTVSPLEQAIGAPSPSNNAVPLAAVLIPTARLDGRSVAQRARQLYGLTEAEARVMAALTLGETVNDIAVEHGVRASTVRAQVRSIFEKTGVNRQSDLVRLALTGAPVVKPMTELPSSR